MPSIMKAPHSRGMNCPMCAGGACRMAEGGGVKPNYATMDTVGHERGVHRESYHPLGESRAGTFNKHGMLEDAKGLHRHKLSEIAELKNKDRSNLADGGDVQAPDMADADGDMELSSGLGKELMHAFESKDHKAVMSALEACVLHCMNKDEGDDDV